MRNLLVTLLLTLSTVAPTLASENFPQGPSPRLTPGALCSGSLQKRSTRKNFAVCERQVNSQTKAFVIHQYDSLLGYRVGSMDRKKFKIDHYFPLCMGGSNEIQNLWPQHESVYLITDPLEGLLCGKINDGLLSQKEAIEIIIRAKNNLNEAPSIVKYWMNRNSF